MAKAALWLLSIVVTAILTSLVGYWFNQKANTEALAIQRVENAIDVFSQSGGQVDTAIAALVDAALDDGDVRSARIALDQAIRTHTAYALPYRKLIGENAYKAYMKQLGAIQTNSGQSLTQTSVKSLLEDLGRLVEMRLNIVDGKTGNA